MLVFQLAKHNIAWSFSKIFAKRLTVFIVLIRCVFLKNAND